MISLEDFKKLELKVAKILEAKEHPNAERLYVLKVDTGSDTRQLVAGIRESYQPEELLNKNIVLLSNIEPANIRGVESQGMLLAAEGAGTICLLIPDKNVPPGSKIH